MTLTKASILYTCPICKVSFDTIEEAESCRDRPVDYCGLEVGSIVVVPSCARYDRRGLRHIAFTVPADPTSESHFYHQDRYVPYAVVTALHASTYRHEEHELRVTLAIPNDDGDSYGWNPANGDGHYAMLVPGIPLDQQRCSVGSCWAEWLDDRICNLIPPPEVVQWAAELAAKPPFASKVLLQNYGGEPRPD